MSGSILVQDAGQVCERHGRGSSARGCARAPRTCSALWWCAERRGVWMCSCSALWWCTEVCGCAAATGSGSKQHRRCRTHATHTPMWVGLRGQFTSLTDLN